MEIEVTPHPTYTLLRVQGELTDESVTTLQAEMDRALAPAGARLVIDLKGVNYINSDGLGALVNFNAQANLRSRRILLAQPSPFVAGVFQMTRLDKFFEVCQSVEEAEARLA